MKAHHITMLGTGLIGEFYTATLHGQRGRDHVQVVYSKSDARAQAFQERWSIPESTTDLKAASTACHVVSSSGPNALPSALPSSDSIASSQLCPGRRSRKKRS